MKLINLVQLKKESYSEEYMLLEFALQFALIDEPVSKKFLIDIIDIMVDKNKELIDLKIMFENPFDFQKLNVGNKDELIKILKEYFDELNEIKKAFYTNHKPKIQIKNLASAKTFDSKASQLTAGIKDTLSLPEAVENENFINKESFLNDESKDSIVENIEKESNFFINSKHNQIDNSKEKITQTSEKAKPIEELELKTSENEAKFNQPTKISNVILNELDILVAKQDLNSFVKKRINTYKRRKKDENSVGPNLVTKEKETAKELHNGSKFTNLNTKEISEKQIEPAFIYKKESTIHKNAQKEKAKKNKSNDEIYKQQENDHNSNKKIGDNEVANQNQKKKNDIETITIILGTIIAVLAIINLLILYYICKIWRKFKF